MSALFAEIRSFEMPEQYKFPWPVSKHGRAEVVINQDNEKELHVHYAINKRFEPTVHIPEWTFDFESGCNLFEAIKKGDKKNALLYNQKLCNSIKDEITRLPEPPLSLSTAKRNLEHVLFGSIGVETVCSKFKKESRGSDYRKIALLNPEPGTIKRYYDYNPGSSIDIFITRSLYENEPDAQRKYLRDIKERLVSVGGHLSQIHEMSSADLPDDFIYYIGFFGEKGRQYGALSYFGFELNPYVAEVKGMVITSMEKLTDPSGSAIGYNYQVKHKSYTEYHRYTSIPQYDRYNGDLIFQQWSRLKRWSNNLLNGIYNLVSTAPWDEFNYIPPQLTYVDCVDTLYCNVDEVVSSHTEIDDVTLQLSNVRLNTDIRSTANLVALEGGELESSSHIDMDTIRTDFSKIVAKFPNCANALSVVFDQYRKTKRINEFATSFFSIADQCTRYLLTPTSNGFQIVDIQVGKSFENRQKILRNQNHIWPIYRWCDHYDDPVYVAHRGVSHLIKVRDSYIRGNLHSVLEYGDNCFISDQDLMQNIVVLVKHHVVTSVGKKEYYGESDLGNGKWFLKYPKFKEKSVFFSFMGIKIRCEAVPFNKKIKSHLAAADFSKVELFTALKKMSRQDLNKEIYSTRDKRIFIPVYNGTVYLAKRLRGTYVRRDPKFEQFDIRSINGINVKSSLIERVSLGPGNAASPWVHVAGSEVRIPDFSTDHLLPPY